MRDRAWRRYKQDVKLLQRLHNIICTYGWGHKDENGVYLVNPSIKSFIGSDLYCKFKTHTITTLNSLIDNTSLLPPKHRIHSDQLV